MKNLKYYITGGVLLCAIIASAIFINASLGDDMRTDGVNHISITSRTSGGNVLNISHGIGYSDNSSYSVRAMAEGELIYQGERLVKDDGLLGQYRIEIVFHGARASTALSKEYPLGMVHEIIDVSDGLKSKYRIRLVYPPDDSMFIIYIGSDEPLNVNNMDNVKYGGKKGTIELVLNQ